MARKKKDVTVRGNSYFSDAWKMRGMKKWARGLLPTDVDTLIGTGLSGSLVVPRLASGLGLNWAIVRKPGVSSHAGGQLFEGQMGRRWALVDDFICSGSTLIRVLEAVQDEFDSPKADSGYLFYPQKWATEFAGVLQFQYWRNGHTDSWQSRERLEGIFYRDDRRAQYMKLSQPTPGPGGPGA